jgi:hypothetical protein
MEPLLRRDLIKSALAVPTGGLLRSNFAVPATGSTLSTVGWVWEGQGLDAPIAPSVYGVGEGAKYFGLRKAVYMFHPNNDVAMEKLTSLSEVICDITKWESSACEYGCVQLHYNQANTWTGRRRTIEEAANVGTLSMKYRNIKGAFFDDVLVDNRPKWEVISPDTYASIAAELKKSNPQLKLWARVYSQQLSEQGWAGFKPHMDVVSLWVQDSNDLTNLDRHVDRCREIFPDKPLMLGCYLWDFRTKSPVPSDLLKLQWQRVLKYVEARKIDGYVILGTYLIDSAQEQARWVRDFIAAN